jgi:glycosyltransferase involved in cell wall biosynthesis
MAPLEAMAVGTRVIASRLAGDAAAVLDGGRYGRLFDGTDSGALAEALLAQIDDPIGPGERIAAYPPAADAYARLVGEVLGKRCGQAN